jgi:hypothetical protein
VNVKAEIFLNMMPFSVVDVRMKAVCFCDILVTVYQSTWHTSLKKVFLLCKIVQLDGISGVSMMCSFCSVSNLHVAILLC